MKLQVKAMLVTFGALALYGCSSTGPVKDFSPAEVYSTAPPSQYSSDVPPPPTQHTAGHLLHPTGGSYR
jgi:PBP1b-binding outer membrane lipoprotein LpoB